MKNKCAMALMLLVGVLGCGLKRTPEVMNQEKTGSKVVNGVLEVGAQTPPLDMIYRMNEISRRFHFFASVNRDDLPKEFQNLPSETQVGLLNMKVETTLYKYAYEENEAVPFKDKVDGIQEEPVFVFSDEQTKKVIFGVRIKSRSNFVEKLIPTQVQVKKVNSYCSVVHVPSWNGGLIDNMKEQDALCDPFQICRFTLSWGKLDFPPMSTQNRIDFLIQHGGRCTQWSNFYERTESHVNKIIPSQGDLALKILPESILKKIVFKF